MADQNNGAKHAANRRDSATAPSDNPIVRPGEQQKADAVLHQAPHSISVGLVGDGLCMSDPHGLVVFVNDHLCKMLGCEPDSLVGQPAGAFLATEADDPARIPMEKCPQCGRLHYVATLRRPDRSVLKIALDRQQIFDSEGELLGTLDVIMDVTGKTQLEQTVHDNAQWHRLIVESLNDIFWVVEIENVERSSNAGRDFEQRTIGVKDLLARLRFTYVSSSFERLFGYPFPIASPPSLYELVLEPFQQTVDEQLAKYIDQALSKPGGASSSSAVVLPLVTANGEPHWCETTARAFYDDSRNLLRFVGVTRDVNEAHLAEESVRASEAKLRAISDVAQDAVIMMDADGKAIHWNPAAERIFGYRADEILGRDVHALLAPRRLQKKVRQGVEEFRRSGEGPVVGNVIQSVAVRKDGSELPVEIAVSPLTIEGRRGAVGIIRDITERTEAEEAVRKEQRRLAQLLDVYEGHRKMATYEIHDGVTQPLVSAVMALDGFSRIREASPDAPWNDFDTAVGVLREALAETRRFMSGMRPPVLDELGVVSALDHLIREHRVSGAAKIDYSCDVHFQRLAPPLETAVFRIVQEGLTNARRHSQADEIRVEFTEQEDRLRIVVQDAGVGFNPDDVPLDHFGLEGIRQRAAAMGGRAWIESTPGTGTSITVDLPLLEDQTAEEG